MATQAQAKDISFAILRMLFAQYPESGRYIVPSVLKVAKNRGTPLARRVARAIIRRAYIDETGAVTPFDVQTKLDFKHWVESRIQPQPANGPIAAGPLQDITHADSFDDGEDVT